MSRFNPYQDNGGSVVALAGENFAVIAADTRLSAGFGIRSREERRLAALGPRAVLATTGCWCDAVTLVKVIRARLTMYLYQHRRALSTVPLAQMLSIELYHKRFFPYYVLNVLAGLDDQGRGCVFSYDPLGNFERCTARAGGSAGSLLQPLLDNLVGRKNLVERDAPPALTKERALQIVTDAFVSAAERDIHTGDSIFINVITEDGIEELSVNLRRD